MRDKKYIWLPLLLLAYGIFMAVYFGREHAASGHLWRVVVTLAVDILVCILLFIFLRKKSKGKYSR